MDNAGCLFLLLLIPSVLSAEGDPEPPQLTSTQLQTSDVSDELKEMKAALAELKMKMEQLQADEQASKVAFSAALLNSTELYFGPYDDQITLVYRHVASNVGNAYNSLTGMFTAPVKGAYHFEVHIHSNFGDYPAEVNLMKNGNGIYMAYEKQESGRGTASNSITLLLEAGDLMYVRLPANSQVYASKYHYSTFSGHLLFAM